MAEEVDDTTNCPVCFEAYTEAGDQVPRLLPCSHSCAKLVSGIPSGMVRLIVHRIEKSTVHPVGFEASPRTSTFFGTSGKKQKRKRSMKFVDNMEEK